MSLPTIDSNYLFAFLVKLLNTPSPTGFTGQAIDLCAQTLAIFPFLEIYFTHKGALVARWPGTSNATPRALTAHVDTLGAMVKEIKKNGRLKLTKIGGYAWNTVEGEGCTVFTNQGSTLRGSLLLSKASSHVYGSQVNETKRDDKAMEVRLDARATSQEEIEALGVQVGNFVAFDTSVEVTNGFIRSRVPTSDLPDVLQADACRRCSNLIYETGPARAMTTTDPAAHGWTRRRPKRSTP